MEMNLHISMKRYLFCVLTILCNVFAMWFFFLSFCNSIHFLKCGYQNILEWKLWWTVLSPGLVPWNVFQLLVLCLTLLTRTWLARREPSCYHYFIYFFFSFFVHQQVERKYWELHVVFMLHEVQGQTGNKY